MPRLQGCGNLFCTIVTGRPGWASKTTIQKLYMWPVLFGSFHLPSLCDRLWDNMACLVCHCFSELRVNSADKSTPHLLLAPRLLLGYLVVGCSISQHHSAHWFLLQLWVSGPRVGCGMHCSMGPDTCKLPSCSLLRGPSTATGRLWSSCGYMLLGERSHHNVL